MAAFSYYLISFFFLSISLALFVFAIWHILGSIMFVDDDDEQALENSGILECLEFQKNFMSPREFVFLLPLY